MVSAGSQQGDQVYFALNFSLTPADLDVAAYASTKIVRRPYGRGERIGLVIAGGLLAQPFARGVNDLAYYFRRRCLLKVAAMTPADGSHVNLKCDHNGLLLTSASERIEQPWSRITRLEIDLEMILFWGDRMRALIVPMRAFNSNEEWIDFNDAACHWLGQSS